MKQCIYVVVDDHGYDGNTYMCAYPDPASAEKIAEEIKEIRRRYNHTKNASNAFDMECDRRYGFIYGPCLYADNTKVEQIEIRPASA